MNYIYNLQYLLVHPTQIYALLALHFKIDYSLDNVPSELFIAVQIVDANCLFKPVIFSVMYA